MAKLQSRVKAISFCLFRFVLFCFVLFCFVLNCFVLFCYVLFCFVCLIVFLFFNISVLFFYKGMVIRTACLFIVLAAQEKKLLLWEKKLLCTLHL